MKFTGILLVDDGHFGPVEEEHDVHEGLIDLVHRRVHVDGEGLVVGWIIALHVDARLHVRDLQCVADGLHVRAQLLRRRTKNGQCSVLHLPAR